jgi:poly-beta-1,6-N-acetyl-D-glucosamine synthase
MLFTVCIGILSVYALFILLAGIGWLLPNKGIEGWKLKDRPILIVPFRDEESNLPKLVSSLNVQTLKPAVLFVDDDSTDASVSQIGLDNFEIILNQGEGKKAACATGILEARSGFLLFTDADCVLQNDHVKNMTEAYAYSNFDFAYGPVINDGTGKSLWSSVFFLDQLSLNAVAQGTGRLNIHLYCSGANMVGKKKVLAEATNELMHSTNLSGDDITLLNYCRQNNKKITAFTHKKFTVTTKGPGTLGAFFRQRLRWGQKTGMNTNPLLLLLSLSVLMASVTVIFSLIASLSESWKQPWYLLPLGKLLIDLLFLFLVSYRLGVLRHLWLFIPAWIFSIIYIPIIGLTGVVYSGYWKGRKISTKNFGEYR